MLLPNNTPVVIKDIIILFLTSWPVNIINLINRHFYGSVRITFYALTQQVYSLSYLFSDFSLTYHRNPDVCYCHSRAADCPVTRIYLHGYCSGWATRTAGMTIRRCPSHPGGEYRRGPWCCRPRRRRVPIRGRWTRARHLGKCTTLRGSS